MLRSRIAILTSSAAVALLALWISLWISSAIAAGAFAAPPAVTVSRLDFPVRLSDGRLYTVAGYLYLAPLQVRHRTLQLLVHGATYDHRYWDAPAINGVDYSYARDMAKRGYVVLAIDQLGAGASSKPGGDFFGLAEAAAALHQVARTIRLIAPAGCTDLAYVGHSNGSVTAIYAQATYGDAQGLISTGWVHGFRPLPIDPADPVIGAVVATPYIDFGRAVSIREAIMYYAPGSAADPAMVAYDNASLLTTMPRRQFFDLIGISADIAGRGPGGMTELTKSQAVRVPVLVQAADRDVIAPSSAALAPPTEQAFYPAASSFELQLLTNVGHVVNLHYDHRQSWDGIDQWLQRTLR